MNQEGSPWRRKSISLEMKSWNQNRMASKQLEHSMENIQKDIRMRRKSYHFETETISKELSEKLPKTTPSIEEHLALNHNRLAAWRERETERLDRRFRSLCTSYLDKDPVDPQLEVFIPRPDLSGENGGVDAGKDLSTYKPKEEIMEKITTGNMKLNGSEKRNSLTFESTALPAMESLLQKEEPEESEQNKFRKNTKSLESISEAAESSMKLTETSVDDDAVRADEIEKGKRNDSDSKLEKNNSTVNEKTSKGNTNKKPVKTKTKNSQLRRFSTTGNPLEFRTDKRLSRRSSLAKVAI